MNEPSPSSSLPPSLPPDRKTITIPLIEYLELLWRHREHASIEFPQAKLIQALDKEEYFCHVEFPKSESESLVPSSFHTPDTNLHIPRVWRIQAWKNDVIKQASDKDRAERDSKERFAREELMKKVLEALQELTGLDKGDDILIEKARKAITNTKMLKTLGIE